MDLKQVGLWLWLTDALYKVPGCKIVIACQVVNVTSATMFLGENNKVLRKYNGKVVEGIPNPVTLCIPETGKVRDLNVDVGHHLFYLI